jgi:hypothetical protein
MRAAAAGGHRGIAYTPGVTGTGRSAPGVTGVALKTKVILESTIMCPLCGHSEVEQMPTNACQWFYECRGCRTLLKPKSGDCCVFCSYGTVRCPPVQTEGPCCP